jgi:hypothetical protein
MDDILKLAYAALDKWRNEVTVDEFIADNKRLNSNRNINSPNIKQLLENCSSDINSEDQLIVDSEFSSFFIPLFNLKAKEEFNDFEKIFEYFLLEQPHKQKKLNRNIPSGVKSIVVHFKDHEVHLDKPKESLKLEDPKRIDSFFSQSNQSSSRAKRSMPSETLHTSKMFDYASC